MKNGYIAWSRLEIASGGEKEKKKVWFLEGAELNAKSEALLVRLGISVLQSIANCRRELSAKQLKAKIKS